MNNRKGRPTVAVWPIVAKCPAHRGPYLLPQLLPPAAGVAGWLSHVDHLKSYLRASMLAPQSPGVAGLLSHIDHLTSYLRAGIWLVAPQLLACAGVAGLLRLSLSLSRA